MAAETRLAELCEFVIDCPHSTPAWTDSGVIVLRNQNIRNGRLDLSNPSYTDEAHFAERTRRAKPKDGDIVITREAPMGEVCMIPPNIRCCLGQRMVLLRPNPRRVDSRYLLYALQSEAVQHEIGVSEGTGSTVSNLRIPLLEALPISTPSLPEQRAIAHVLGTLDDKVELNRRMSETLEGMARALFKSWFVDFDPVRAKVEGRDPGLPKPLAGLFPTRLIDSELGEIPEGWEVAALDSLASIQGGKQLPTEECNSHGAFPVYGANGKMGFADRATHGGFVIAFGRVGAYCGSVHWAHQGAWINNNASSVVPHRWPEYVLQSMLAADFARMRRGSAQPFIPNSSLASMLVPRPSVDVLDRFCSIIAPLRLREHAMTSASCMLTAVRGALLPKLISGQLRQHLERICERVEA